MVYSKLRSRADYPDSAGVHVVTQTAVDERVVGVLRAPANPVRYRIVTLLAAHKDCAAGQLRTELQMSQSSLFEHLAHLRDAGILQTSGGKARTHCSYCLNPDVLRFRQSA